MKPAIYALGLINALGNSKSEVMSNWLRGIAPGMVPQAKWIDDRDVWVGTVSAALPTIPPSLASYDCRNNQLLLAALAQIEKEVAAAIKIFGRHRIGVVIGSSTSGIAEGEAALAYKKRDGDWPPHYHYQQQEIGSPAAFLSRFLELDGIAYTVSTACSSSAKAMGSARQLLELDLCDVVICGGSDSLCKLTLNGFSALDALSAGQCKPFSATRDGINIGEGAALFLMSKEHAYPAPKEYSIFLAGVGESADAHHISAPQPDGEGAEAAMQMALADAGISANDIDYINLHGTATALNDAMESAAVFRVFGQSTPCSSTKTLTGHTLGAAGATEAALCWLLLSHLNEDAVLPSQIPETEPDTSLAGINVLRVADTLPRKNIVRTLSNSFAFGGSNTSIIFEACS